MLAVFPFHRGDKDQAIRLAGWIRELSGVKSHPCLLIVSHGTDSSGIIEPLREAFASVTEIQPVEVIDGWPQGPNNLFQEAIRRVYAKERQPWLFLEPDAVPLCPEWLDRIEAEYKTCGKPFMGCEVIVPEVARHLSGVSVYPGQTLNFTTRLWQLGPIAFDVFFAQDFLHQAHFTKLIQHQAWTSRNADNEIDFKDLDSLKVLNMEAVLFHRSKNGSLIDRLRENKPAVLAKREMVSPSTFPMNMGRCVEDINALNVVTPSHVIHTYFEKVEGISLGESAALLDLWKTKWSEAGWIPRVLSENDAKAHLFYASFCDAIDRLPSINPEGYDRACYMRHLAMAAVGGGWLSDYDVMPLNFSPRAIPNAERFTVHQAHNPCPSLVSGSAREFERICLMFMTYRLDESDLADERPHTSDMLILQKHSGEYDVTDTVKHYTSKGWESAACVHFPNGVMGPAKKQPRSEWIPKILASPSGGNGSNGHVDLSSATVPELISALRVHGQKDNFAIGRIRKQLKAAKLIK